eukprot:m51a1_g4466 hypothetical protein (1454) ;mRNA; f:212409-226250
MSTEAAGPLAGMVFLLHNQPLAKKHQLAELIRDYGGTVALMCTKNVTHVVATPAEIKERTSKMAEFARRRVAVVTESFLADRTRGRPKAPRPASSGPPGAPPSLLRPLESARPLLSASCGGAVAGAVDSGKEEKTEALLPPAGAEIAAAVTAYRPLKVPVPVVTLCLPSSGPNSGDFQVAVVGLNFIAGPAFRVRFGTVVADDVEFHANTSIIAHVPSAMPGIVMAQASNDSGATWGFPVEFRFFDALAPTAAHPVEAKISMLRSQLQNMRRAITNIQQMEIDIRTQLSQMTGTVELGLEEEQETQAEGAGKDTAAAAAAAEAAPRPARARHEGLDREVRLFISSPFRDMREERDRIVKLVIPKLRKVCMERDVVLSYVDLRWGVTGAQSEQATMLLMCLREVEKSSAVIGLYGERYGWSITTEGDTSHNDLLARSFELAAKEFPWINDYRDRSVTELEMRMVLRHEHSGDPKPAWFYLRDAYFLEDGPQAAQKLAALKSDICASGYPVREYMRPAQVTELVLDHLREYIDSKFPESDALSDNDRENFRHQVFAHSLRRVFLPAERLLMALDKHVAGELEQPLVVVGEPGCGKSALIANWIERHREHHPENVVVEHYVGCSAMSTHYAFILWRVMDQVMRALDIEDEQLPDPTRQAEAVVAMFPAWIEAAVEKRNPNRRSVVICIDGLNKIDERQNALELVWFPRSFPSRVRVVVTTLPNSRVLHALKEAERKSFVRMYLNQRAKKLNEQQEFKIASTPQTANPRFLQTLLDDIAVFGEHENLEKRLTTCLEAKNTAQLYQFMIHRLEADYDPDNKGTVKHFLSFLSAARRGLNLDTELAPLLEAAGVPLDDWQSLFVVVEDLLVSMGGIVSFANEDIASAVRSVYLWDRAACCAYHAKLAALFAGIGGVTERKVEELPYQYEQTGDWDALSGCISSILVFDKLFTPVNKYDLFRYVRALEKNVPSFDVVAVFTKVLSEAQLPQDIIPADLFYRVGKFFDEMSKFRGAEQTYLKAIELYSNNTMPLEVAKVKRDLAQLYSVGGRTEDALRIMLQVVQEYEKEKGPDDVDVGTTLNRLGQLYIIMKRGELAHEALDRALIICESQLGADHPVTADVNYYLGCLYLVERDLKLGNLDKSEEYLKARSIIHPEALKSKEQAFGYWHPDVANVLNRLGSVYVEMSQFNDAEECFKLALEIRESALGPRHSRTAQTLKSMINLYEMQELLPKALDVAQRALDITREIFGPGHKTVANILLRIGFLYFNMGKKDESRGAFQQAIDTLSATLGPEHPETVEAMNTMDELILGKKKEVVQTLEETPIRKTNDRTGFVADFNTLTVAATCVGPAACNISYMVRSRCLTSSDFTWALGPWSACEADCHQSAPLTCLENGEHVVGPSNCSQTTIPLYRRRCSSGEGQCRPGTIEPNPGQCRCWCSRTTRNDEQAAGTFDIRSTG